MPKQEIYLANQEQTRILAAKLAKIVALGDIITLTGNLGAGKTSFVQYLVNSLAEKKIEVTSPSFNLMHLYQVKAFEIWHFDLYRLKNSAEIYELGIEDAWNNGITIIEWPEIIQAILPSNRLELHLDFAQQENARILTWKGMDKWAVLLLQE